MTLIGVLPGLVDLLLDPIKFGVGLVKLGLNLFCGGGTSGLHRFRSSLLLQEDLGIILIFELRLVFVRCKLKPCHLTCF